MIGINERKAPSEQGSKAMQSIDCKLYLNLQQCDVQGRTEEGLGVVGHTGLCKQFVTGSYNERMIHQQMLHLRFSITTRPMNGI